MTSKDGFWQGVINAEDAEARRNDYRKTISMRGDVSCYRSLYSSMIGKNNHRVMCITEKVFSSLFQR
jgi:hypothetical protein